MDGLNSAKCQKSKRRDIMGILEIVNEKKDKNLHSVVFPIFEGQNVQRVNGDAVA